MAEEWTDANKELKPSRRMALRILDEEAYRRILAGNAPESLSDFGSQLAVWFKDTYPSAPEVPERLVEQAIASTWHRRHEIIGSEL
jgi:hypothetical protein